MSTLRSMACRIVGSVLGQASLRCAILVMIVSPVLSVIVARASHVSIITLRVHSRQAGIGFSSFVVSGETGGDAQFALTLYAAAVGSVAVLELFGANAVRQNRTAIATLTLVVAVTIADVMCRRVVPLSAREDLLLLFALDYRAFSQLGHFERYEALSLLALIITWTSSSAVLGVMRLYRFRVLGQLGAAWGASWCGPLIMAVLVRPVVVDGMLRHLVLATVLPLLNVSIAIFVDLLASRTRSCEGQDGAMNEMGH